MGVGYVNKLKELPPPLILLRIMSVLEISMQPNGNSMYLINFEEK